MNAASQDRSPLVSVAIPVYNGQSTIAQTLHSVLAQTHGQSEVIVVDDGSTDGTWDVLKSFGPSIRSIRQPNGGLAAARNTGVLAARGEFIALMDADDICEPERIAAQVHFLKEHPTVLLCCSDFSAFNAAGLVSSSFGASYYGRCSVSEGGVAARYPNRGRLDISNCMPRPPQQPLEVPIYFGDIYEELSLGNFVHPPTVMFRRSVLKDSGLFEPEARTMCDWDWLVKVARLGAVGFIDRPLLQYRLSTSQMSSDKTGRRNSVRVAHRICERDSTLWARQPEQFRKLFGELYADAADACADEHPMEALLLVTASVFRYRALSRQTPRTLFKTLVPMPLLRLLRSRIGSERHAT